MPTPDLPSRLIYPAGLMPGYNPTHIVGGSVFFSSVVNGNGNFVNLMNGATGTVTATPGASGTDAAIGPYFNSGTGTGSVTFAVTGVLTDTVLTFGCIFIMVGTLAANQYLITDGSLATGGCAFAIANSTQDLGIACPGGSNVFSAANPVIAGIPYFAALSVNGSNVMNIILRRLDNGTILQLNNISTAAGGFAASNGTYVMGNGFGSARPANAKIAAGMVSKQFHSPQDLMVWAQRPWSFWYPAISLK